jgi:hypothetical protein
MKRLLFVLSAAVVLAAGLLPGSAAASTATKNWVPGPAQWSVAPQVTVVHGVPGLKVDVYVVNNLKRQRLDDVEFKALATLELDPGFLYLAILPADDNPFSRPIFQTFLSLKRGANLSAVAHLDASGRPAFSLFENDVSDPGSGRARVIVRHLAAAPAVDILAGGSPVISNLTNPNQGQVVVPGGTYPIAVAPAGSTTPVFGPANLTFAAGTTTIVYAVGSLAGGSFTPLIQTF